MSKDPTNRDLFRLIAGVDKKVGAVDKKVDKLGRDLGARIDNSTAQVGAQIQDLAHETEARDDAIQEKLDGFITKTEAALEKQTG